MMQATHRAPHQCLDGADTGFRHLDEITPVSTQGGT